MTQDPIPFIVDAARRAAERGRRQWRDHGGPLADRLDEAMDGFELELRAMAGQVPGASIVSAPGLMAGEGDRS